MPVSNIFTENAVFKIEKLDSGTHYIDGTLSADRIHKGGKIEKIVLRSIAQTIHPEDLEAAKEFCKTGKGPFRDKIDFGEMRPHSFTPS